MASLTSSAVKGMTEDIRGYECCIDPIQTNLLRKTRR
jgi:hypothetical protein